MELVILIIALAYLANLHTHLFEAQFYQEFKSKYLNYKILNCSKCFGFYLSLPFMIYITNPIFGFLLSLVTSLVAAIIEKILFKW